METSPRILTLLPPPILTTIRSPLLPSPLSLQTLAVAIKVSGPSSLSPQSTDMDQQQQKLPRNIHDSWIKHQRNTAKTTQSFACLHCLDRRIFNATDELWKHATADHRNKLPADAKELEAFRTNFEAEAGRKRSTREDSLRKPIYDEASCACPEPPPLQKRPLFNPVQVAASRSLSRLQTLNLGGAPLASEDMQMMDLTDDNEIEQPRKRAAIGDGISAGSASPFRDWEPPPPRRSKARSISAPYGPEGDFDYRRSDENLKRPHAAKKRLWTPDQDSPVTRSSFDPSSIASIQAQKCRNKALQSKSREPYQASLQVRSNVSEPSAPPPSTIFGRPSKQENEVSTRNEGYEIILQTETRPISQEQLVAEVKGIYAGLVMVEAICIEVDNKHATITAGEIGAQPKLNNEQWQALIALHRTLLHEHHDFFLASQQPSNSPALRRLASKYTRPARMWRHGLHSFLRLLQQRLPTSFDHMLAFIDLAYLMTAILYEEAPALEDTWIECLGDLGRYRMAIEDDDIRDREVWTAVTRHWYSKASNKAPTMGRLYHQVAVLTRSNTINQLYYYWKPLCVPCPLASTRESILNIFDPSKGNRGVRTHRFPSLNTVLVAAHGSLFPRATALEVSSKFDPAALEPFSLLMVVLGTGSKGNIPMRATGDKDVYTKRLLKYSRTSDTPQLCPRLPHGPPLSHTSPFGYILEHGVMHSFQRHSRRGMSINNRAYNSSRHLFPSFVVGDYFLGACSLNPNATLETLEDHSQSPKGTCSYQRSPSLDSLDSMLQNGLNSLGIVGRKLFRFLNFLGFPPKKLFFAGLIHAIEASSVQNPLVDVEGCEYLWIGYFRDTIMKNCNAQFVTTSVALFVTSRLIVRYDRDRGYPYTDGSEDVVISSRRHDKSGGVFGFTCASVGAALYMGKDERVSNYVLTPVCVFSAWLIFQYHSQKLAPFETTAAAMGSTIVVVAFFIAEVIHQLSSPFEGRYENPWVFRMVAILPATVVTGWIWEAFALKLGYAKRFEDRFLHATHSSLHDFHDMEACVVLSELFSDEEVTVRYQSWLNEKKRQAAQTRV